MTRQEIIHAALSELEAQGAHVQHGGAGEFYFAWSRQLDAALDEYVNPFAAVFKISTTDVVSGQEAYCPPSLKRLDRVHITLLNNTKRELHPGDSNLLLAHYPEAYTQPQSGDPTFYVWRGVNRVELYPIPNFNKTAGLEFEGFGNITSADWPNPTSQCPLPTSYQPHLIWGLCARMSMASNPPLSARYTADFLRGQSVMNTDLNAYTRHDRTRSGYGWPENARTNAEDPFVP